MALSQLSPFNQVSYASHVQPFVDFVIPYVQGTTIQGRTSWKNHFLAYSYAWGDGTWRSGLAARYQFRKQLDGCSSNEQFLSAVNGIMSWGGLRPFDLDGIPLLTRSLRALALLDRGKAEWQAILAQRIASVTKVYAIHDLEKWAIYDSRAANGLARLVSAYWGVKGHEHLSYLLRFPQPLARTMKRVPPDGFPRGSSQDQFRLAFIYASWLLRAIADRLNAAIGVSSPPSMSPDGGSVSPSSWKVYHMEMILFMLGQ